MSFNLFQIGPAFIAGVAFYISFYYVVFYFQSKRTQRFYFTFGLACVGIWFYDFSCLGLYLASNVTEGEFWQRCLFFVGPFITISLVWFFFDYTSYKRRAVGYILALYFVVTMVVGLVGPAELTLDHATPRIIVVPVTHSLQVVYYEVASGPLKVLTQVAYVISALYCLWIAVKNYNLGRKKESVPLFFAIIILAAGIINDIAVGSELYKFIYLFEYAYLGIILLMANTLSNAARAANLAKTEFLANMSHELRTPLNATLGFTEALSEGLAGPINPAQKEQLNIIYETNSNYLELIDALINVANLESGKSKLIIEGFSLKDLVHSCIDSLKDKAAGKSMEIGVKFLSSCSPEIRSDKDKIKQVLRNLLDNAIKFTPKGGKCGVVLIKRNKECQITVWDTGIGISEENQLQLFLPLHQLAPILTKEIAGIGLGLYFSKKLVEFIGGRIWVESKVNEGTKVNFTIPIEE